jgi:hypothetical protein
MSQSFIKNKDDTPDTVAAKIEARLGFKPPKMCGYHMLVEVYIRDEVNKNIDGTESLIYIPKVILDNDKYRNCTGLVLAQGPQCYKGRNFDGFEKWCEVGDWIVFPRNEGVQVNFRGRTVQFLPDDMMFCVIDDPSFITRD